MCVPTRVMCLHQQANSGVATLSCTDCSGSSTASSDIADPGSPFSTASSHSEDSSGSSSQPQHQQSTNMPPITQQTAHLPPWPWTAAIEEGPPAAPVAAAPSNTAAKKRSMLQDKTAFPKRLKSSDDKDYNNHCRRDNSISSKQSPPCLISSSTSSSHLLTNINNNNISSSGKATGTTTKCLQTLTDTASPNHNNNKSLVKSKMSNSCSRNKLLEQHQQAQAAGKQGKITEYFRSQMKLHTIKKDNNTPKNVDSSSNNNSNSVKTTAASLAAKFVSLVDQQTQFNGIRSQSTRSNSSKKLDAASAGNKGRKVSQVTVPRKILPAPSKIPDNHRHHPQPHHRQQQHQLPSQPQQHHPHMGSLANFAPTVTLTALSFPSNLAYIHTKTPKPPENTGSIFVPHHQFAATISSDNKISAIPIINRTSCLNVIHHQPAAAATVQKITTINNFNCVKLNAATVVPIVKLNTLPSRLNSNPSSSNSPSSIANSNNHTNSNNLSLSLETGVPTVLTAKPKECSLGTSNSNSFSSNSNSNSCYLPQQPLPVINPPCSSVVQTATVSKQHVTPLPPPIPVSTIDSGGGGGGGVHETSTATTTTTSGGTVSASHREHSNNNTTNHIITTATKPPSSSSSCRQEVEKKSLTSTSASSPSPSPSPAESSDSGISSNCSSYKEALEVVVVEESSTNLAEDDDEDHLLSEHQVLPSQQKSPILCEPKTIRFPARQDVWKYDRDSNVTKSSSSGSTTSSSTSAAHSHHEHGLCRWAECNAQFDTSGALLEHLQVKHVISQATQEHYVCLWLGCKVHGRTSCSRSWLERHVLAHAGTKPFRCIVDGCGHRFNSQIYQHKNAQILSNLPDLASLIITELLILEVEKRKLFIQDVHGEAVKKLTLERHVNGHFNSDGSQNSSAKKATESASAKLFKRNGKKIRFRRQPWSARMFDFIDSGIMEGLQHKLLTMTQDTILNQIGNSGVTVNVNAQVMARRVGPDGIAKVLVKWSPEDIIPDEWVSEKDYVPTKSIPVTSLQPSIKDVVQTRLFNNNISNNNEATTNSRRRNRRKPTSNKQQT